MRRVKLGDIKAWKNGQ